MHFSQYSADGFYDEMFHADGTPRPRCEALVTRIHSLADGELQRSQRDAERMLMNLGITFTVYGHSAGTEKIWPFDVVPRVVESTEFDTIERGLKQRIIALNLFINDVYNDRQIIRDGIVPEFLLHTGKCYLPACEGLKPPRGVWAHVTGTDLVRDTDGQFYVLEDNMRCPSGVSYVLENREVMKRTFPQVFEGLRIRAVEDYPERLLRTLQHVAPHLPDDPTVVVLTPGVFNSAYFEHSFLAQQMGVELVEGRDLVVLDDYVFMRTTQGIQRVDCIYRRIDDTFLDPETFRDDSMLGVAGLMRAYRAGHVALANAPGTGIADDKAIYAFVPQIVNYYLGEDIILPNVPTYICADPKQCDHVLANLENLVVKPTNESGGYGLMIGPKASAADHAACAERIKAHPREYIAQPMISLSRVPSLVGDHFEGRHVDLRPYILYGEDVFVLPGGLTRVALQRGSLVVNSSQGGGSKDTWVLQTEGAQRQSQSSQEFQMTNV